MTTVFSTSLAFSHAAARPRLHLVRRGDTLWDLAAKYLGNANRWPEIHQANRHQIRNPHLIYPGQVLRIPARGVAPRPQPPAPRPQPQPQPQPAPPRPLPPVLYPPVTPPAPQPQPQQPWRPQLPSLPRPGFSWLEQVGGFFKDVAIGGRDQLGEHGRVVLHPRESLQRGRAYLGNPSAAWRAFKAPYQHAIRSGHPGQAVGRLLANVALVGGVVVAGRALLGRFGVGGGPSVGYRGPVATFFSGVADTVSGAVRAVTSAVGSAFRWLLPSGGGPSVGF